jgi:PhnB protein
MELQPYLFFDGRCEEAIEFYKKALDVEVEMLMRFKDSPEKASCPVGPGMENKVMHASLRIRDKMFFASDGNAQGKPNFQGFGLSLSVSGEDDARRLFGALEVGGKVIAPLTKTFFSPLFGMVADRFGVMWMIMVAH